MMHARLLSLKTISGKSHLSFDLTSGIVDENPKQLEVSISGRNYILEKRSWVNTLKVWDNNKVFFIVCSKNMDLNFAKEFLIKYSINLVNKRIDNLNQFKSRLQGELAA